MNKLTATQQRLELLTGKSVGDDYIFSLADQEYESESLVLKGLNLDDELKERKDMTEIKRYKIQDNFLDLGVKGGLFVREEDYAALQVQVLALAAENLNRQHLLDMIGETGNANFGKTRIETPATDAALREIRAHSVEALRDSISDIDNGIETTIDLHHYCTDFAARIRAGEQP